MSSTMRNATVKTAVKRKTDNTDYAAMREELLEGLLNAEPFAFDLNADALYRQYRDSYRMQGYEAASDAFGKAATSTGGFANSYAASIAAQTYNDYMSALQDKGLQLYENAYVRYRDDYDRKKDLLSLTDSFEREQYDRDRDAEQEEYERGVYAEKTEYERNKDREQTEYDRAQDAEKTEYERKKAQEKLDYDRAQDAERQAYDRRQDDLAFAYKMAQLGDFSYLKKAGVDVSFLESEALAKQQAPEEISVNIQNGAEDAYYNSGYAALLRYLNRQIGYGRLTEKGKQQIITALAGG